MRPARRRRLVDQVRADWKVSIRWACATFLIDTSLYHNKSKRGEQADFKDRIREIAQEKPAPPVTRMRFRLSEMGGKGSSCPIIHRARL